MWQNSRCSILFHLLVPGGKWQTSISIPSWLLNFCNSAFSGNQQPLDLGVTTTTQTLPPTTDRLDGELGSVAADADTHPGFVTTHIIDAVGDRFTFAWVGKVVHLDFDRFSLRPPATARILEISQGFLLLGIDRDRWLALTLLRQHPPVDVAELTVPVWVTFAFSGLPVRLQAITCLLQQTAYGRGTDGMALSGQFLGQPARTLTGPAQRRLRVATTFRFHQAFQTRPQIRLQQGGRFPSTTRS